MFEFWIVTQTGFEPARPFGTSLGERDASDYVLLGRRINILK